jgi:hypothetical protein
MVRIRDLWARQRERIAAAREAARADLASDAPRLPAGAWPADVTT